MAESPTPQQNGPGPWALLAIISTEMIGTTGVGVGIGYWAWSRWGWPWWILLVSSGLALVGAFYRIYRVSQRWNS